MFHFAKWFVVFNVVCYTKQMHVRDLLSGLDNMSKLVCVCVCMVGNTREARKLSNRDAMRCFCCRYREPQVGADDNSYRCMSSIHSFVTLDADAILSTNESTRTTHAAAHSALTLWYLGWKGLWKGFTEVFTEVFKFDWVPIRFQFHDFLFFVVDLLRDCRLK